MNITCQGGVSSAWFHFRVNAICVKGFNVWWFGGKFFTSDCC